MADLTISKRNGPDSGTFRYDLGRANWARRSIPNIKRGPRRRRLSTRVRLPENRMIDVVILGDGYMTPTEFEDKLEDWIESFYKIKVYDVFRGAFRIRALYRPSTERASDDRDSYYRVKLTGSGGVDGGGWQEDSGTDNDVFRDRMFADVDSFSDVNTRCYPPGLDLGQTNLDQTNELGGTYRNLIVCMLVRTDDSTNASGRARYTPREVGETPKVRVAFGANDIHEFSHAFGFLKDEYIEGRDKTSSRDMPDEPSVLTLSNLAYSTKYSDIPWRHISPFGLEPRQAGGDAPSPLIGWAWIGGAKRHGVWHAEYNCLLNGTHDNFLFTQDEALDPTSGSDGRYVDPDDDDPTAPADDGAYLRDKERMCLWCQEITALRILERTDQLDRANDPSNIVEAAKVWYQYWVDTLRANYWDLFDVPQQIADQEAEYASMTFTIDGEVRTLEESDLYVPFSEDAPSRRGRAPEFDDGAWLVNLG